jgi:hypothetical protein
MGRRSAALASRWNVHFDNFGPPLEALPVNKASEQAFPIRWETFQEDLHKERGFVDFLIVDDFTSYNLWDDILENGIARLGIRPEGYSCGDGSPADDLPEGKWRMLHAMRPLAADELYARAGVTKPCSTKLPAVYCLVHGEETGTCLYNVHLETALEFIKRKLFVSVAANDDSK